MCNYMCHSGNVNNLGCGISTNDGAADPAGIRGAYFYGYFDVNRKYNYLIATEERGKINELDRGFRRSGDLFRLPQAIFSAFPIDLIALISFSPGIMSGLMSSFLLCVYA